MKKAVNNFKTISAKDIKKGTTVLLRADFNVAISHRHVPLTELSRIESVLPTIDLIQKKGGRVVLISHIGRKEETLEPVSRALKRFLNHRFIHTWDFDHIKKEVKQMKNGEVVLLENLRKIPGEEKNDKKFAKDLASLASIYVNDAFSVSHRAHASVVGVAKLLPPFAGLQLASEIKNLSGLLGNDVKRPLTLIIAGAKFETKLPVIKAFLKKADKIIVGGALINTLFKAQGLEVGRSLYEDMPELLPFTKNKKIYLPKDLIVLEKTGKTENVIPNNVLREDKIVDVGKESVLEILDILKNSKTVVWNGPLGIFEQGYEESTLAIAKLLRGASSRFTGSNQIKTILGGGDTVSFLAKHKISHDDFSFVSLAGGAMLEFLSNKKLPGIVALQSKEKKTREKDLVTSC